MKTKQNHSVYNKKTTTEKPQSKKSNAKKLYVFSSIAVIAITIVVAITIGINRYQDSKLIRINNITFSKADFMIYVYALKINRYGAEGTKLPKATLSTLVDKDSNITVASYLKERATENIKVAAIIEDLAEEYNIELDVNDYKQLREEKTEFINQIGGISTFLKTLKENKTTESAYDKMAEVDALYRKVLEFAYSKDQINDLSELEYVKFTKEYYDKYYKARQVVLATVDPTTKRKLDSSVIELKRELADNIYTEAKKGVDFDQLIKNFSEDVNETDESYAMYFESGQLIEEIEKTVSELKTGEISIVVESNIGFHIIIRDRLDDGYLEYFLQAKREDKLINDISQLVNDSSIIITNRYEKLKITK